MANKKEAKKAKQSFPEKLILGIVNWFNMLRGKPKIKPSEPEVLQEPQPIGEKPSSEPSATDDGLVEVNPDEFTDEEDSVAQDLASFKKFVGKNIGVVKERVAPSVEATKKRAAEAGKEVKGANFSWAYKVLPLILIIVVLLVAATLVINLSQRGSQDGGDGSGNGEQVVDDGDRTTPTPAVYNPYVPSIYANDPQILRLEEEINVLSHELSTVLLKESLLSLPNPDFNIRFDD
jgi:hypothetical protein